MLGGGRWKVSKELSDSDINKDSEIITHKIYFPPTTHCYNDHIKHFILRVKYPELKLLRGGSVAAAIGLDLIFEYSFGTPKINISEKEDLITPAAEWWRAEH